MEQYISKSALVAEIEKMVKRLEDAFDNPSFASYEANLIAKGGYRKLKDILSLLDTLEVKEIGVDIGSFEGDLGRKAVQVIDADGNIKEITFNKTQKGE